MGHLFNVVAGMNRSDLFVLVVSVLAVSIVLIRVTIRCCRPQVVHLGWGRRYPHNVKGMPHRRSGGSWTVGPTY